MIIFLYLCNSNYIYYKLIKMNKRKKIVTTTTTVTEEIVPAYKKTHIICVLDRSGSMKKIMADSIGGFNSFIEKQKELPDEATLSVYIFDDEIEIIRENIDIKEVKPITEYEWFPRGMTSLYDAIGTAINKEKKHIDDETKVLVCVVTDGDENNSKEYNQSDIKTMISDCEKNDWTFIFLAANQDACFVGKSLGFAAGNTFTYQANSGGVIGMSNAMNYATVSYRSNSGDISNLLGNNGNDMITLNKNNTTVTSNLLTTGDVINKYPPTTTDSDSK
jgi:hypothetical protein